MSWLHHLVKDSIPIVCLVPMRALCDELIFGGGVLNVLGLLGMTYSSQMTLFLAVAAFRCPCIYRWSKVIPSTSVAGNFTRRQRWSFRPSASITASSLHPHHKPHPTLTGPIIMRVHQQFWGCLSSFDSCCLSECCIESEFLLCKQGFLNAIMVYPAYQSVSKHLWKIIVLAMISQFSQSSHIGSYALPRLSKRCTMGEGSGLKYPWPRRHNPWFRRWWHWPGSSASWRWQPHKLQEVQRGETFCTISMCQMVDRIKSTLLGLN